MAQLTPLFYADIWRFCKNTPLLFGLKYGVIRQAEATLFPKELPKTIMLQISCDLKGVPDTGQHITYFAAVADLINSRAAARKLILHGRQRPVADGHDHGIRFQRCLRAIRQSDHRACVVDLQQAGAGQHLCIRD